MLGPLLPNYESAIPCYCLNFEVDYVRYNYCYCTISGLSENYYEEIIARIDFEECFVAARSS